MALGSGFFIAPKVFLTCHHVVNPAVAPHQDGDIYHLVTTLVNGARGLFHVITPMVGKDLILIPDYDAAIIRTDGKVPQAYISISYDDPVEGQEIGVAGYPLAQLSVDADQNLNYGGVFYRVCRGVVTAVFNAPVHFAGLPPMLR